MVTQTYTLTKTGSTFGTVAELIAEVNTVISNSSYLSYLEQAQADELVTVEGTFDGTNSLTVTREWDDAAYATFVADYASDRNANRNALEAAGWTVTGDEI